MMLPPVALRVKHCSLLFEFQIIRWANSTKTGAFYWHTCHISVVYLIFFVHSRGPKIDKPDESMKNVAELDEICH